MKLQERLQRDLKQAMRNGDAARRGLIRYIRSAIHDEEIARKSGLDDAAVIDVLGQQAKQRLESIDAFKKGDRPDLVAKEEAELAIIREYMPAQLSDEEISELARAAIEDVGATAPQDMGKVMGRIMPQVRGKAEGRTVSRIVQELLKSAG
jgi:uncharacterized protein YqeY